MKQGIVASILTIILSVTLSIFASVFVSKPSAKRLEVAGVIRSMDEKGWFVIDDAGHTPLNIAQVEVKNGMILIHYAFSASTIHSFVVTPDETFARAGFFAGASVQKNLAAIAISQVIDGKVVPVDASTIRSKFGNFWIYGLFSLDEQDR